MTEPGGDRPRVVRVFVSSTFRDMQLEREELIKRVFPQVRRLCESRGVAWSEIDLRWGVTDEQKAEGAVLPICLAEIERSRPYFIGMLGQRYGWVPDEIPAELARRLGWLDSAAGRSVTELEILHGVLNDPASAGHAFFYLRNPAWVDAMAAADREPYVDGPVPDERLAMLKDRVRHSPFPVRDYTTPTGIGALVLEDLTALVERLYPEASVPDPLDREAAQHAAHAASRFDGFVARPDLSARLDAHAEGTELPLMVTGPAGVGASALVANWVAGWRAAHPGELVVEHYVGASAASADWTVLVDRLVGELARGHGLTGLSGPEGAAIPDDSVGRRAALETALVRAAATGRGTLIVVDGVDQLVDVDGAVDLAWLPAAPPAGVRIVVTAPGGPAVDAAAARGWPQFTVPPLTADERRDVAITFLAPYAKALDDALLDQLAGADGTGNALYLRVVLDELRQHGDHFTLGALLDRLLAAASVDDLIELVLARYERDYEQERPGLVGDAMAAIWAARRGLSEAELLDVLGPSPAEPLPRATWSPLFLAAEEGLVTRSGYLAFGTEHHSRAVADRYCGSPEQAAGAHARLAAYFATEPVGPRVVDELPWQLLAAGDHAGLAAALGDVAFVDAAMHRSYADLRRLWARAEAAGHRMVDAYAAVIAEPSAYPAVAWQVARLLTDAGHRAEAMALHRYVVAEGRQRADGGVRLRGALVNLGAALWVNGELDEATTPLTEAATLARAAGDTPTLIAAVGNLALVYRDRGELDQAGPFSDEEEVLCRASGDPARLQSCLGNRAQLLRQRGDVDGAMALMVEQERLCRSIGDRPGVARALAAQAAVHADRGNGRDALPLFDAQVALCRELGDLRGLAEARFNQALTRGELGDAAGADEASTEAEALARRFGDLAILARVLVVRAGQRADGGRWAEAEQLAREGELAARSAGAAPVVPMALGILGIARREQGDLAGAAEIHAGQLAAAEAVADPGSVASAITNLAALDIATGQLARAIERYAEAEPVFRRLGTVLSLVPLLTNRGQVFGQLGDLDRALADYRDAADLAGRAGLAPARHTALTLAIELQYASGRPPPPAQWEELAEACRAVGDDAGLQRAVGERALLLIGAGDLAVASSLLDEQEAICRRIGHRAGLAACIGNRAIVLRQRGDPAGALTCIDEQVTLVRAVGDQWGLIVATANRGDTLGALGRIAEGLAALREARQGAAALGVAAMVAQLDQMITALESRQ